jgi:hypothetical protein
MKQFGLLFQLVLSTPRTEGIESGLLPTPNTMEAIEPKSKEKILEYNRKGRPGRSYATCNLRERIAYGMMEEEMLQQKIAMLASPMASDYKNKLSDDWTTNLSNQIAMLPTPVKEDWRRRGPNSQQQGLPEMIHDLLPSPRAGNPGSRPNQKGGKILAEEIAKLPVMSGQNTGMKLQPAFVEWMMNFPIGWTEIE